jgi:hypothetical protein
MVATLTPSKSHHGSPLCFLAFLQNLNIARSIAPAKREMFYNSQPIPIGRPNARKGTINGIIGLDVKIGGTGWASIKDAVGSHPLPR